LNKGFTLLELSVSMVIFSIVGGLALNSLVASSKSFSDDKKNIESSQNLSAALGIIGNDVKQAGEQIRGDDLFPAIELQQEPSVTLPDGSPVRRSTLVVRSAVVTSALTLCADIPSGTAAGLTSLVVRDTTLPVGTNPGCSQNPAASATPSPLRSAVNYRCELGDRNFNFNPALDSCAAIPANPTLQNVLLAVSRQDGNICMFRYTGENLAFSPSQSRLNVTPLATCANGVDYNTNLPIYLIEERRYTLDTSGNLQVSVNGGAPSTLIGGIATFKVSARGYRVTAPGITPVVTIEDRIIDGTGGGAGFACTAADEVSMGAGTQSDPNYACRLNFGNNVANWKWIAGIRIELQARYDSAGRTNYTSAQLTDPNTNNQEILKLRAAAEFFPRNVLSR
jgi:prepilin-type N-terminal cleavage/methylation domain-containing protein